MPDDQLRQTTRLVLGHVDVRVVDQLERRAQELGEPPAVADRVDQRALALPRDERRLAERREPTGGLERLRGAGRPEGLAEVAPDRGVAQPGLDPSADDLVGRVAL